MGNDKKEMPEKEDVLKAIIDFFKDIPTDEITAEYIKNVVGCDEESATIMLAVIMHDRGQLREEVKELVLQDDEKALDELYTVCKTVDEIFDVVKYRRLLHGERKRNPEEELTEEWKKIAYDAFKDIRPEDLRILHIQKKLNVGYSLALRIRDWLMTI